MLGRDQVPVTARTPVTLFAGERGRERRRERERGRERERAIYID